MRASLCVVVVSMLCGCANRQNSEPPEPVGTGVTLTMEDLTGSKVLTLDYPKYWKETGPGDPDPKQFVRQMLDRHLLLENAALAERAHVAGATFAGIGVPGAGGILLPLGAAAAHSDVVQEAKKNDKPTMIRLQIFSALHDESTGDSEGAVRGILFAAPGTRQEQEKRLAEFVSRVQKEIEKIDGTMTVTATPDRATTIQYASGGRQGTIVIRVSTAAEKRDQIVAGLPKREGGNFHSSMISGNQQDGPFLVVAISELKK